MPMVHRVLRFGFDSADGAAVRAGYLAGAVVVCNFDSRGSGVQEPRQLDGVLTLWVMDQWLASKIEVDSVTGCWIWKGAKHKEGYGIVDRRVKSDSGRRGRVWLAHRYVWEVVFEKPPAENLHHKCRTPACVNPDEEAHLVAMTLVDHQLEHHYQEVCSEGHMLDESNAYLRKDGRGRQCRICKARRERDRRTRSRVRADA